MQRSRVEDLRTGEQCCAALHFGETGVAVAVSPSPSYQLHSHRWATDVGRRIMMVLVFVRDLRDVGMD